MEAFESYQNKHEDIISMSRGEGCTPQEAADKIRAELGV